MLGDPSLLVTMNAQRCSQGVYNILPRSFLLRRLSWTLRGRDIQVCFLNTFDKPFRRCVVESDLLLLARALSFHSNLPSIRTCISQRDLLSLELALLLASGFGHVELAVLRDMWISWVGTDAFGGSDQTNIGKGD